MGRCPFGIFEDVVNYSLIFVALTLLAGLAVDVGMLERSYLQLQAAAQAAAMGSSIALQQGGRLLRLLRPVRRRLR
jgi:Flp pilus assembly protein TadG